MGSIERGASGNVRWSAPCRTLRAVTAALGLILVLPVLAGCSSAGSGSGVPGSATAPALTRVTDALGGFYSIPSPLPPGPPGSLVRVAPMATGGSLPPGTTAFRVLYHSETQSGADVAVSGMVVVPGGTPPPGGFPIVTWAHGTTGLAPSCAPSLEGAASIPLLGAFLGAGWIVAATDYEGLGASAGLHPYLVGASEAQDVLDAARAARAIAGASASNTVVVAGHSQGGQAALFAGQIAPSYAPELFVAGVAAVAPVTSTLEFAPAPGDRTDGSMAYLVMAAYAWSRVYGNFPLDTVLSDRALRADTVLTSGCAAGVEAAYDPVADRTWLAPGWGENAGLLGDDQANRPGDQPTSAPLLVVQGTADTVVPAGATDRFVTGQLCAAEHDTVEYVPLAGAGHTAALTSGQSTVVRWIRQRLSGRTPPSSCGRAGTVSVQTSRKRRTANADPTTPTPIPTIATSTQVPPTSQPLNDIWAMMLPWFSAVFVVSRPIP
jgi:alpha-beta hydrolase superfamily lysophospholipase